MPSVRRISSCIWRSSPVWLGLAASLGEVPVWLPGWIGVGPRHGTTAFVVASAGLLAIGITLGVLRPERPWRWGLASVLLFPVTDLLALEPDGLLYVVAKVPLYAIQAVPAVLGACLGAAVKQGTLTYRDTKAWAPRGYRFAFGCALGFGSAWVPLLVVEGDPPDHAMGYAMWLSSLFLTGVVVGRVGSESPGWKGFVACAGFAAGMVTACVRTSPCNLLPLVMWFSLLVAAPPTFIGIVLARILSHTNRDSTSEGPSGPR